MSDSGMGGGGRSGGQYAENIYLMSFLLAFCFQVKLVQFEINLFHPLPLPILYVQILRDPCQTLDLEEGADQVGNWEKIMLFFYFRSFVLAFCFQFKLVYFQIILLHHLSMPNCKVTASLCLDSKGSMSDSGSGGGGGRSGRRKKRYTFCINIYETLLNHHNI